MAAILFNGKEHLNKLAIPFQQKGPHKNLVKVAQAVSEKKTFKNYTILYKARAEKIQGTKF